MARVIMIGLDAASLEVIEHSRASLPALGRLLDTGTARRFRSRSANLLPASVWPTFYTGTPPGQHGVYYPLQWDAASMSLKPTVDLLHCEPFWVALEERGCDVIAVDVPVTWRSRLRRGIEVTDWATHEAIQGFAVQPASLAREIRREVGGREIGPEIPVRKSRAQLTDLRGEVLASIARKGRLIRWLMQRQRWDLFVAVFGETHRAGHLFWPDGREHDGEAPAVPEHALIDCYRAVDREIGEIMHAGADRDTVVIVFSVHGMGANRSQEHFTRPIMARINARFAAQSGAPAAASEATSMMRVLRERLPPRLQHAIGRLVPISWKDAVVNRAITGGYDWPRTPGLAILGSVTGFVRFNLRGRERDGMLDRDSDLHRRYTQFVRDAFHSWRFSDTGQPLVDEVVFAEETFPGDRKDYLPDAVVVWADRAPATRVQSDEFGGVDLQPSSGRSGNHRPDGFALVLDPHGARDGHAGPADIVDFAPMVSRLLARGRP